MAGKSRNWHILSNKAYSDTEKGRDVYNEQQLEIDNTDLKLEAVKAGQDYFAIKYVTGNT